MGSRATRLILVCAAGMRLAGCRNEDANGGAQSLIYFAERVGGPFAPRQVFVMQADGSDLRQLTPVSDTDNDEPVASPDGRTIAFASKRDMPPPRPGEVQNPTLRMIYLMDSDGTNVRRLTANSPLECSEHAPSFSPDGEWVAFQMSCDHIVPSNLNRVFSIRRDGSGQQQYGPSHPDILDFGNQGSPVFDREGRRIVFTGEIVGLTGHDAFSMNADGSDVRRLTRCADHGRSLIPRNPFSVVGREVYFVSDDFWTGAGRAALERVSIDGGAPQQIQIEIEELSAPDWLLGVPRDFDHFVSPEGDRVVFVSYDDVTADPPTFAIVVSAVDGSSRTKLRSGGDYARPTWHTGAHY